MADPTPLPVQPDRLIQHLRALVRVPSVTGDERAAAELVASWLWASGADVERWDASMAALARDPDFPGQEVEREQAPLVVGRLTGTRPGPTVMLSGHLDVVPPGDLAAWTHDPYAADREGDRIIGRGACDMKAGLAACIEVFLARAARPDFAGELLLVAVPGEEDGGSGTLAAIRQGLRADVALIAEPTGQAGGDPRVVVAHGGALTLALEVTGRGAHACFRRDGESALDHFIPLYQALRAEEARLNAAEPDPLMRALGLPYATNVGVIQGGDWASTVMDALRAEIRVGVALGETTAQALARTRAALDRAVAAQAQAGDGWLAAHPPSLEAVGGAFRGARLDPSHPAVERLRACAAGVFGQAPEVAAMPYGCDMRLWQHLAGVPTFLYGPGVARVAHTADEWVSVAETTRVAQTLAAWVQRQGEGA